MAATGTTMTIIKDVFSFLKCEEMMKNCVDRSPVKDISYEEVARGLVTDTTTFITRDFGSEFLCT